VGGDGSAVHLHQGLADGESEPQPAELPRDRPFGLLEGIEDPTQGFRLEALAAIADFGDQPLIRTRA